MRRADLGFLKEVARAGLPPGPGPDDVVTAQDVAPLPEPVRCYMRFMGVEGRPRDWSFRLQFTGRFRTRPGQRWMRCRTWQYNTRLSVARLFLIRVRLVGVVPLVGRDTYLRGRGRLRIRLLDLFTLADAAGPEYDLGELVTYLNDAVLFAPSMLLGPEVTWSAAGADAFDVALGDAGRTVAARVFIDGRGAPTEFSTTDKFCADPANPNRLMRARWTTPVAGWDAHNGRRVLAGGRAIFHLPQGPFTYADFSPVPGSLAFNLAPGA